MEPSTDDPTDSIENQYYTVDDMLNVVKYELMVNSDIVQSAQDIEYVVREVEGTGFGMIFKILPDEDIIRLRIDFYDKDKESQGLITLIAISTLEQQRWNKVFVDRVNEEFLSSRNKVQEVIKLFIDTFHQVNHG